MEALATFTSSPTAMLATLPSALHTLLDPDFAPGPFVRTALDTAYAHAAVLSLAGSELSHAHGRHVSARQDELVDHTKRARELEGKVAANKECVHAMRAAVHLAISILSTCLVARLSNNLLGHVGDVRPP